MKLFLVRHAEAKSREEDPASHLSGKGRMSAEKIASFLAGKITVEKIFHSGKTRAKETADIFAKHLKSKDVEEKEFLDPLAEPEIWAERLKNEKNDLMIAGHLPYLSDLVSLLLCGNKNKKIIEFKTGGVVCLFREGEQWIIDWMTTPENLKNG